MPTNWVNFKEIKEKVPFSEVLDHYSVTTKQKGDQWQGFCPLPGHEGEKKSPSFSVNIKKGIWQCFACKAKGNVIDFVARMEGLNPENSSDFRKAALFIQKNFINDKSNSEETEEENKSDIEEDSRPHIVNVPLDFQLKKLDPNHSYFNLRKINPDTVNHFGLGYCSKGLMAGRIVIPLHDNEGNLIGYAGRLVDDDLIDVNNPKYKFPGSREKDGNIYEFSKSKFLFNGFKIQEPVSNLIVVEGFFAFFWLFQCGYTNTVTLMGSSCSEDQAKLIMEKIKPSGTVWLMPDGDKAGEDCACQLFQFIAPYYRVKWVQLSKGIDPEDCSTEQLKQLLT